jgi:hypothetical protein
MGLNPCSQRSLATAWLGKNETSIRKGYGQGWPQGRRLLNQATGVLQVSSERNQHLRQAQPEML